MKLHKGTKLHVHYMILEFQRWHTLSQRISDHQFSANVLNNHFLFLTRSLMTRYLMSMCFASASIFIVLCHKDNNWIVAIYTQWPRYWIHNSKPGNETLKPYTMRSSLKTGYELSFHSKSSCQGLFNAPPRYSSTGQYKNVSRC